MSKVNDWLEQDKLTLLEAWARDGLTDEQICNNMGICVKTLWNWKNKNLQILQALKKGKEVVDYEVENALLKRALGYKYKEITKERVYNSDTKEYELKVTKEVEKEVVPDTTAQIYWLKNRKSKQWKDKQENNNNEQLDKLDKLLEEQRNAYLD